MSRTGTAPGLHPLVRAAAEGALPEWAVLTPARRGHVERVAALLEGWATELGLGGDEALRWKGVGMLHDVLRDEAPERLLPLVPPELADLPPEALHAPAAAVRLRDEGVEDEEFLRAVSHHPIGDPGWGLLGRFLYLADFLEPGRSFRTEWREELRSRAVRGTEAVLREVVRARIGFALERGHRLRPETVGLWNDLAGGGREGTGG